MCYSFGTSQRGQLAFGQAPGPGAYNAKKSPKKIPPEWRFGTGQRGWIGKSEAPGPGSYQHDKSYKQTKELNIKYTIRPKTAYQEGDKTQPGPGSYDPKVINKEVGQPKYSFGLKTMNQSVYSTKSGLVGPGQYEYKSTMQGIPCMKMGTSKRQDMSLNNWAPGPGTYLNIKYKSGGPQFGFGSSQRDGLNSKNAAPGPGSYEIKSMINMGVGKSLSSRNKDLTAQSFTPGPGTYNPEKMRGKQSVRIGSAQRQAGDMNPVPGPGAYKQGIFYDKPHMPQYRIGSSNRRPLSASDRNIPGPGNYQYKSTVGEGPQYGFGIKTGEWYQKDKTIPGPGNYNPKNAYTIERIGSPVFGRDTRKGMGKRDQNPGPGNYMLKDAFGGPRWGFGSSNRGELVRSDNPGPGSYNIPKKDIFQVPKYLLNTTNKY